MPSSAIVGIALGLGHLDQLDGVVELGLDRAGRGDRLVEPATLAHHVLRGLGIVPQRLVLDARVEFVEPAERAVPIEEAAQQRERVVDLFDMGLRFGAHGKPSQKSTVDAAAGHPGTSLEHDDMGCRLVNPALSLQELAVAGLRLGLGLLLAPPWALLPRRWCAARGSLSGLNASQITGESGSLLGQVP